MIGAPLAAPPLPSWRAERILYDEAGLLVVDKPPGIPVHGGDESLGEGLVDRLGVWLTARGRPTYLGVHGRLDEPTSGAILFTTDESRNLEVARSREAGTLKRVYRALVRISPASRLTDSGKIELLLDADRGRSRVVDRGGKRAVTHYHLLERRGDLALVELSLETGRTHQIRVSLAHVGAPVIGDVEYGGEPAERLFLHAAELSGAPLPTVVTSPMPEAFVARLEGRSIRARLRDSLLDAALLRAPLPKRTTAFRLCNGEGDGIPGLVVDGYGPYAALGVYDEALVPHLDDVRATLEEIGYRAAYLKQRVRADLRTENAAELAPELPFFGEPAPSELVVEENGMLIAVSLADGLSTGLFVDQRDNRQKLHAVSAGKRLLNLFCYTGSFSVAAARVGARTTSVDLSGRALARAKRNFELNSLPLEGHQFFKDDAMKYLERAVRRGEVFDRIVLDPPSFATVGKSTFSVKGRYQEAATACVRLLAPHGSLLAVTNHTKTSLPAFRSMLHEAAARAGREVSSLRTMASGLDCPSHTSGSWPSKSVLLTVA